MSTSIVVPTLGESINEAIVARWLKQVGEAVQVDEPIVELETDKITVEVPAPSAGVIVEHKAQEGATVNVGDPIAALDPNASAAQGAPAAQPASAPANGALSAPAASAPAMPAAAAEAKRSGVDLAKVSGSGRGGRILKEDVKAAAGASSNKPAAPSTRPAPAVAPMQGDEPEQAVRMTPLRKRIAERLVQAQRDAAILTTFNEVDMSGVMQLRKEYKQSFIDKHGVKLGFMSFFAKACVEALKAFPAVNAEIRGEDIVYKHFYHIGVAVGGGKGLVVPVVRHVDQRSFANIESEISRLAGLARDNKLQISDLSGGTFTISNGGVYGSMLSTPILNSPQTGILGLHNIIERPMVVDGQVQIRPMMYLALSYDHRVIDGREAVQFLLRIKECIEDPRRLLIEA